MDDPGIVLDDWRAGIELDGTARLGQCLLLPAQLDQGSGEPRPNSASFGASRGLAQVVLRAGQIVRVQQCVSEVEVRGGVAGVVGKGGLVAGDRLVPPVPLLKQIAEAVVGDGDGRMPVQQAAVQVDGGRCGRPRARR